VIACFPVYRTYITATEPPSADDQRYIAQAVQQAKRRAPGTAAVIFDFIEQLLLKRTGATAADECEAGARFIGKFQQITSPVAAKGIEDTTLYIHNRLLSLNEVGSNPTQFGLEPSAVHAWLKDRQARWPAALSTLSTHDTKRGEDVRARLNIISELPGAWKDAVGRWRAVNRRLRVEVQGRVAPSRNEEYLLYQTLVGSWPFEDDDATRSAFTDRMVAFTTKALREAKLHTTWMNPDQEYESAVERFLRAILDRRRANPFLAAFEPFQQQIAELGIYNGLAQQLIKITAPGVPDFYQGTEVWDLSLVDPDNRRPVDYVRRRELLAGVTSVPARELLEARADGRIKMFVIHRALAARASMREVYDGGDYLPLATSGARGECVFAFARVNAGNVAITCVPRLIASLMADAAAPPLGRRVWSDTRIELPERFASGSFRNAFTGARLELGRFGGTHGLPAATLFDEFPVALLVPCST
jgi:(1->4)-alpha-D-glucan 1-alpha-D-glucosylmutase